MRQHRDWRYEAGGRHTVSYPILADPTIRRSRPYRARYGQEDHMLLPPTEVLHGVSEAVSPLEIRSTWLRLHESRDDRTVAVTWRSITSTD